VGDGSVRDSLSALDQAIACCGVQLKAPEVRALLGIFSLDALSRITQALAESNSARMLEIVDELVRDGHHLQHFCRELARYFRNLLVAKIAGRDTRAIAASRQERERFAEIAVSFSEEDLTRYLQLTLDLFRELQFSLQPRLHMEIGLIRLVEAGKLLPIEQALASLGQPGGASPLPVPKSAPPPLFGGETLASPSPAPAAFPPGADWKTKLHAAFLEMGMTYTADAIEHSQVIEAAGELHFTVPKEFSLSMKPEEIQKAVQRVGGGKRKIRIAFAEAGVADSKATEGPKQPPESDDEAARRALAHPEVQRFREAFPDAEVRTVRNLKE